MKNLKYTKENAPAIGRICAEWRKKQLLSQEEVAKEANVTQQTVSLFERGKIISWQMLCYYIDKGVNV